MHGQEVASGVDRSNGLVGVHGAGPLLSVQANTSAKGKKYACDEGCPQETFPVCGKDGEWYQNKCIAFCADIEVDDKGTACRGGPCNAKKSPLKLVSNNYSSHLTAPASYGAAYVRSPFSPQDQQLHPSLPVQTPLPKPAISVLGNVTNIVQPSAC